MSGPFKVLVDKKSAELRGSKKSDTLPINKSHSDMVKFREGSEEYQIVATYIQELIESLNDPLGSRRVKDNDGILFEQLKQLSTSPTGTNTGMHLLTFITLYTEFLLRP